MKLGKVLATTAVSGMLAALSGCGGAAAKGSGENMAPATPASPATDMPSVGEKNCCKGKNACKGKSGCKSQTNAACAGQNDCKGKGTSCPRG